MAYSEVSDLMIGDTIIGGGVSKQAFINAAADEIDSKIGWLYVTPVAIPGSPALPRHEVLLLKGINNKLATGRLILTLDIAGEGTTLHAYGARLVKEAMDELLLVANGTLDLTCPRIPLTATQASNRVPGVINLDEESLVLPFVKTVHGGIPWQTRPGEVLG